MSSNSIDPDSLIRLLPPSLSNNNKHKGQAGRIGIVGGSLEYTGAPYFAAISALKVGADLVHVFCAKEAATVIKSYSPELIVHPLLNVENAVEKIRPWFDRLHVIVMGPGLGREQTTFKIIKDLVKICKINKKPLILDADALIFFHNERDLFKDYPAPIILTPNLMEFKKLTNDSNGQSKEDQIKDILDLSPNLSLVCKGPQDEIFNRNGKLIVSGIGSGRRCGGQGDILSGSLPVFLYWSSLENTDLPINVEKPLIAGYAACRLVRECNQKAFKTKGRSMTASDIINEIHSVFDENFEIKIN